MAYHLKPEDDRILASFRGQWRAAGWGADADCYTDVPYGNQEKFFASLILPDEFDELMHAQQTARTEQYYRTHFSPLDSPGDRRAPLRVLSFETIFNLPNFVTGSDAAEVCMEAVRRAIDLYSDQVPRTTTELGRLAAINFGHSISRVAPEIPVE
jgi:hypothetical protein